MIVIPKQGETTEIILSADAMQQLGLEEGQAIEISLPQGSKIPYDDTWLEDDNLENIPKWLRPKEVRERLKGSVQWAQTTPRKSTTLEEINQLLGLEKV